MNKTAVVLLLVVLAVAGAGGIVALERDGSDEFVLGNDPSLPTLTFYTTGLATTPQLPFWRAVKHGGILKKCNIRVRLWKNLDDLRGILLAGEGDLWLGHTDGFAQAASRNAPVRLMATTGWRKFYLVSTDPEKKDFEDFEGRSLAFAPPGSPAIPVLESISREGAKPIEFRSHEPRQLAMKLVKGDIDAALLPEPLVTTLLLKVKGLKVMACVEEAYGLHTGGPTRMPIAGLAVNAETAEKHPELMKTIAREMLEQGKFLEKNPRAGVDSLPPQFEAFVSRDMVLASLERDPVAVELSYDIKDEILDYLGIVHPHAWKNESKTIPEHDLFWK